MANSLLRRTGSHDVRGGFDEESAASTDTTLFGSPRGEKDVLLGWTIQFKHYHFWTVLFPLVALASCLFFSFTIHFQEVTKTHCRTPEWFPSISTATGDNEPQKYIWRLFIGLYSFPKLCLDISHFYLLPKKRMQRKQSVGLAEHVPSKDLFFSFINFMTLATATIENVALYMLTAVSNTDNRTIHANAFIAWLIAANCHFAFFLITYFQARLPFTSLERTCFTARCTIFGVHSVLMILGMVVYYRHRVFCEPGMYSLASLCEWTLVALNVAFHTMGIPEWHNVRFVAVERNNHQQEKDKPSWH